MLDVDGKTAFITGAASGIGRGMANALGEAGMRIMLADIDRESLTQAETELKQRGVEVASVVVDVTKEESVFAAADATIDVFGKVMLLLLMMISMADVACGTPSSRAVGSRHFIMTRLSGR